MVAYRTTADNCPLEQIWYSVRSQSKEFHLSEAKYLEFRWEMYNALNQQNLGFPNTTYCLSPGPNGETDAVRQAGCSFGLITNIQTDPRAHQFALKFGVGAQLLACARIWTIRSDGRFGKLS